MKPTMLERVQTYLAQRRALGYQLRVAGFWLRSFARYADRVQPHGGLTRACALHWACSPRDLQPATSAQRLQAVRRFAQFLVLSEPHTEIPSRYAFGPIGIRRPPHIYSAGQIRNLLARARQLSGQLRPHTMATLLGLLAATGLRIGEALRLDVRDVQIEEGWIVVRQSKYSRTRLVPLHSSALPPLRAYARQRQRLFPLACTFFVSERGTALAHRTVCETFGHLRRDLGSAQNPPRLHDLRHTFACRVLLRCQTHSKPTGDPVLVLARYLGHATVRSTFWYLHASPALLAQVVRRFRSP
ncbi:MAG: tyrosine-type recombinase/integrase [Verrucomicrobia bacterium]|nr:tyrosine-type recombinase/integrase [Verrucomicrobiota bacterium]